VTVFAGTATDHNKVRDAVRNALGSLAEQITLTVKAG